jgi:hypothetical protein
MVAIKDEKQRTANIVLAIVGQTVVNSTFVILLSIHANVGLTFFILNNKKKENDKSNLSLLVV